MNYKKIKFDMTILLERKNIDVQKIRLRKNKNGFQIIISIGSVSNNMDSISIIRDELSTYSFENDISFSSMLLEIYI